MPLPVDLLFNLIIKNEIALFYNKTINIHGNSSLAGQITNVIDVKNQPVARWFNNFYCVQDDGAHTTFLIRNCHVLLLTNNFRYFTTKRHISSIFIDTGRISFFIF